MLDSYQDLIDELLGTPTILRQGLDERSGASRPEAARLIAALRDRDLAVLERLQTMLRQRDPVLRPLPEARVRSEDPDPEAALAGFSTARGEVISLLMNLTLRDWERTAIDASGGKIMLDEEVERHVEFDEEHVERFKAAISEP